MADYETVEDAVRALEEKDAEITKLTAHNEKLFRERKGDQSALAAFGEITAEEAKRLKGIETELGAKSKNVDERLTTLRAEFDTKLAEKDTEIAGLNEGLEGATITTEAHAALEEFGGNSELLMDRIKRSTRLEVVDGKRVPVVIGDDGKPRVSPSAKTVGQPMAVREFVEELSKDERLAGAFAGTGSSGGGATNQGRGGAGPKVVGASEMTHPTMAQLEQQRKGELIIDLSR